MLRFAAQIGNQPEVGLGVVVFEILFVYDESYPTAVRRDLQVREPLEFHEIFEADRALRLDGSRRCQQQNSEERGCQIDTHHGFLRGWERFPGAKPPRDSWSVDPFIVP